MSLRLPLLLYAFLGSTPLVAEGPPRTWFHTATRQPSPITPAVRRVQWLAFTSPTCLPCRQAEADYRPWLAASRWQVDATESAHVRLVDGAAHPDLTERYEVDAYPTFVLVADGREVRRHVAYPGREALAREYLDAARTTARPLQAISIGRLPGGRAGVRDLIERAKTLLGPAGQADLTLRREGASVVEIGENLSLHVPNPLTMRYRVEGDVLRLEFPGEPPAVRMRVLGLPSQQKVSAVSVAVSRITVELPGMVDLSVTVEE